MTAILTYAAKGHHGELAVDLDVLVRSRLLIQANSGGGKSWALRQLLEQTFGRVQHLVLDPEGEYATLRERFDYVLGAKHGGDVEATPRTAKVLCRRLMETSTSAVLDLYDLKVPERREFVRLFLTELLALPKDLRRPLLVVLDEAHVFAPEGARSEALEAVVSLASQGRKRGYALVCATQRLSKLSKDVAAELNTKLIGRTGLDLDVKRAGDELGMSKEARAELPLLGEGMFYVYGPALPPGPPRLVKTGKVLTSHPQPGAIEAPVPEPSAKVKALIAKSLADLPQQATEEARTVDGLRQRVHELEAQARKGTDAGLERAVTQSMIGRAVEHAIREDRKRMAGFRRTLVHAVSEARGALTIATKGAAMIENHAKAIAAGLAQATTALEALAAGVEAMAKEDATPPVVQTTVVEPQRREMAPGWTKRQSPTAESMNGGGLGTKILQAIAELGVLGYDRPSREQLGFYLGRTLTAGHGANVLGSLRTNGLVSYPEPGLVQLDTAGAAMVTRIDPPTSLDELHNRVRAHLSGLELTLFDLLVNQPKETWSREELGQAVGRTLTAGHGANVLGGLRTAGLVIYPIPGRVAPSPLLFPEGLA